MLDGKLELASSDLVLEIEPGNLSGIDCCFLGMLERKRRNHSRCHLLTMVEYKCNIRQAPPVYWVQQRWECALAQATLVMARMEPQPLASMTSGSHPQLCEFAWARRLGQPVGRW